MLHNANWNDKLEQQAETSHEDVSREEIVSTFRAAMVSHFRSHVPGSNINEATLLASDYLNHFHELVMLLEAVQDEPQDFADDLLGWRPLTYEEHFEQSGFRDKSLAIAAYRRAPQDTRTQFDGAVARLHQEAVALVAQVADQLKDGQGLNTECLPAAARLRALIDDANAIANGYAPSGTSKPKSQDEPNSQIAVDALFSAA